VATFAVPASIPRRVFSAVVINWNGKGYLEACLSAVIAQVPAPDEVLLLDNHSDDGSREFTAERFPGVRVVDVGSNRGPSPARNLGVRLARHDVVLVLDNDVVLEPGAAAALLRVLDAEPRTALVQARSVCADRPELLHYDAADLHPLGLLLLRDFFRPRATATPHPTPTGAFVSLCFVVRKPVFVDVGGFDEDLFIYFEDTDLGWRLRLAGHELRLCPDAIVHHGRGTPELSLRADGALSRRRVFLHSRNRAIVLLKNMRWRTLVLTAPMQLAYATLHLLLATSKGCFVPWLSGKWALLRSVPATLRKRADVQRRRAADARDRDLLIVEPLTLHPGFADRGLKRAARRALDGVCRVNWRLVRRLCG
jgi:GT2 family glycosyltransferase